MQTTLDSRKHRLALTLGIIGIGASACAFQDPKRVENDFGNSVRLMVAEQIYDPAAAQNPAPNLPPLIGDAATTSISTYGTAGRQSRAERTRQAQSVVPISGAASTEAEE